MNLAPLLAAPPVIQIHAFAALGAFALGALQLAAPKGTIPHRTIGWIWAGLMLAVVVSSFFIHTIRLWGPFSPIHLLSIFTLAMLPLAVAHARRHAVERHRRAMLRLFVGALVIAGIFTFLPGRIMHAVVFEAAVGADPETVGFAWASVPDDAGRPIRLALWYPSRAPASEQTIGPYRQTVAAGGAMAGSGRPLIVISHGTGGSALNHYDTALALAEAGFVVAALEHPGDNWRDHSDSFTWRNITSRPRHIRRAVEYMLSSWAGHERIDPGRIGIFGHSAGGSTALIALGGEPKAAQADSFCRDHPEDWGCAQARQRGADRAAAGPEQESFMHEPRLAAAVIAAPALGHAFVGTALGHVIAPVQLWKAAEDRIAPSGSSLEPIKTALPTPPETHLVPGAGHFAFLAPCSPALAAQAPEICQDPSGFDRAAFHSAFNPALITFFQRALAAR